MTGGCIALGTLANGDRLVVTNTLSPTTIGEESPTPGTGIRQRTFSFADQYSGALDSRLIPSPRDPRQPHQSSLRISLVVEKTIEAHSKPRVNNRITCSFFRAVRPVGYELLE